MLGISYLGGARFLYSVCASRQMIPSCMPRFNAVTYMMCLGTTAAALRPRPKIAALRVLIGHDAKGENCVPCAASSGRSITTRGTEEPAKPL
jgi:hypothetical protein